MTQPHDIGQEIRQEIDQEIGQVSIGVGMGPPVLPHEAMLPGRDWLGAG